MWCGSFVGSLRSFGRYPWLLSALSQGPPARFTCIPVPSLSQDGHYHPPRLLFVFPPFICLSLWCPDWWSSWPWLFCHSFLGLLCDSFFSSYYPSFSSLASTFAPLWTIFQTILLSSAHMTFIKSFVLAGLLQRVGRGRRLFSLCRLWDHALLEATSFATLSMAMELSLIEGRETQSGDIRSLDSEHLARGQHGNPEFTLSLATWKSRVHCHLLILSPVFAWVWC